MKFRPVREFLEDAMKECFEAETWAEMENHIRIDNPNMGRVPVVVGRYIGPDTRIGWKETYVVTMDGWIVGYIDSNGKNPE